MDEAKRTFDHQASGSVKDKMAGRNDITHPSSSMHFCLSSWISWVCRKEVLQWSFVGRFYWWMNMTSKILFARSIINTRAPMITRE